MWNIRVPQKEKKFIQLDIFKAKILRVSTKTETKNS